MIIFARDLTKPRVGWILYGNLTSQNASISAGPRP